MKNFVVTFAAALLALGVFAFAYEIFKGHQRQKALDEVELTRQAAVNVAYLAEGLSSLAQLKPHIEMFWHETGNLPCGGADLDLPTEILALQNRSLHGVALVGCGKLEATYTELSGLDGGKLLLRAREVEAGSHRGLVWDCVTPDYPEIELSIPGCRYEPRIDQEAREPHLRT